VSSDCRVHAVHFLIVLFLGSFVEGFGNLLLKV
jgi:hypothetical protein